MVTLRTIAYVVGITIAISAFGLFLYSFLPHIIENDQWERIQKRPDQRGATKARLRCAR